MSAELPGPKELPRRHPFRPRTSTLILHLRCPTRLLRHLLYCLSLSFTLSASSVAAAASPRTRCCISTSAGSEGPDLRAREVRQSQRAWERGMPDSRTRLLRARSVRSVGWLRRWGGAGEAVRRKKEVRKGRNRARGDALDYVEDAG